MCSLWTLSPEAQKATNTALFFGAMVMVMVMAMRVELLK